MSRITEFYKGTGTDSEGRTLAELWAYTDDELEGIHDFIQWMFPLRQPSRYNARAPLLTDADVAEFRADPALRDNLMRSFEVFLAFLRLRYQYGRVTKAEGFDANDVFQHPDHNWLRITRILTSTRLLGLEPQSEALFAFLKGLRESGQSAITTETYRYWESAARTPVRP